MDQSNSQRISENLTVGIVGSLMATVIVGVFVAVVSHLGSTWTVPIIHGVLTAMLTLAICLGVMALRVMPKAYKPTTVNNVEQRIRQWLDNFHLTVKNSPIEAAFFNLRVTTDGGKHILIARSRDGYSEYLQFTSFIGPNEDEKKVLLDVSEKEKALSIWDMKLELSRARMGYSGFASLDGFTMFKRIPISRFLDEATVINSVWEMEAMLNAIYAIGAKSYLAHLSQTSLTLKS
ncbi:MAG: hypothetical protein JWQ42_4453 [Edaphobacter sp.]|jgi:uncharacterized membrane protein YeaQ/YmgE (transglycosylase-associated protein family)|nr:hypothetical protein [Edaphobacter sp.]